MTKMHLEHSLMSPTLQSSTLIKSTCEHLLIKIPHASKCQLTQFLFLNWYTNKMRGKNPKKEGKKRKKCKCYIERDYYAGKYLKCFIIKI